MPYFATTSCIRFLGRRGSIPPSGPYGFSEGAVSATVARSTLINHSHTVGSQHDRTGLERMYAAEEQNKQNPRKKESSPSSARRRTFCCQWKCAMRFCFSLFRRSHASFSSLVPNFGSVLICGSLTWTTEASGKSFPSELFALFAPFFHGPTGNDKSDWVESPHRMRTLTLSWFRASRYGGGFVHSKGN